ncbi:MAG: NADH-quinone oxidoreductase subunit L [Chloroflexi bacterium]|nr:NADH-quinone oxidoreductase subunit L [Chloroflexota bacterium]
MSLGMEWAWLLPAVCAGACGLVVLCGRRLPNQGAWIAIAAIAAAFALFWPVTSDLVSNGPSSFSRVWFDAGETRLRLGMTIDQLTIVMLGLVTSVALAVQVFSLGYMKGDPRIGWYFSAHSLFAAAMLALVLADNLLVFYVAWELVGLCSYLLIGFWYEKHSAAEAAKKAFVTTRIADVALLAGILTLYKVTGTLELSAIFEMAHAGEISHTAMNLSATLIFIGAMGKSAQVPFHVWLPDAMEGPTPVSALIHAATMVAAGVYLVARMAPLLELTPGVVDLIAYIGLATAIVGAVLAFVQNDLKKVLAYSTISQLGFMMLAMGSFGFTAGIFHLLTHGFFKALLFLGAGSIIHAMHEEQDIRKMGGLGNRLPVTYLTFAFAALTLIGIFPLSGFWSKDEAMFAILEHRGTLWFSAALVAVGMTGLYVVRMVALVFWGEARSDMAWHAHESPIVMVVPMVGLLVPAVGLGMLAIPYGDYEGFGSFLFFPPEGPHEFKFHAIVFSTSLAVAFSAAIVGRILFYAPSGLPLSYVQARLPTFYRLLEEKLYFDRFYQWLVDRVVLVFSSIIARFDRRVVNDIGVNGPGQVTVWGGKLLRYHETGVVSAYVWTIAATAMAIILIVITTT